MNKVLERWKKYSYWVLLAFLVGSLFDFRLSLAAIICMAAPVISAVFKGRYWCGNMCPRGSFYDNIAVKFSRGRRVPYVLKSVYFRVFVFVFMMFMFAAGIKQNWGNAAGIGFVFYRMIVVTTIIGMVLAAVYNQRTWCHFCPMGSMAALTAWFRKSKKVLRVEESCISCRMCEKKCPLGLVPYEYKGRVLSHHDCIQCGKCADICPKKSIGYGK